MAVSWRAIFFINLPVAIGAVVATVFAVRESRDETVDRRVDYPGVIALTEATGKELANDGVRCTAICPGFVDTAMTDFIKEQVKPEDMIQVSDIAETVRVLLRMSPGCVVPEIQFVRPGERL